jgi:hypothetical protein
MAEITPDEFAVADFAVREHRSLWGDAWRRLQSSNTARLGMVIVFVFYFSAVFAHFFWEYDPRIDLDYSLKLKPPTLIPNEEVPSVHLFGTDKLGRDIFPPRCSWRLEFIESWYCSCNHFSCLWRGFGGFSGFL